MKVGVFSMKVVLYFGKALTIHGCHAERSEESAMCYDKHR
jgi:hypothetical protein